MRVLVPLGADSRRLIGSAVQALVFVQTMRIKDSSILLALAN